MIVKRSVKRPLRSFKLKKKSPKKKILLRRSPPSVQSNSTLQIENNHAPIQFAGINNGSMTQNNKQELFDSLTKLIDFLKVHQVTDQSTWEAYQNINIIQKEAIEKAPDKSKMEKAALMLQNLTNFTQLASFVIQVRPLVHQIQECVAKF